MLSLTDAQLHEYAKKRVNFRAHLIVYCIIIGTLWLIWFLTERQYIWPIWPTAGWGIGLLFHYLFDYRPSGFLSEEAEFEKLKKRLTENSHFNQ